MWHGFHSPRSSCSRWVDLTARVSFRAPSLPCGRATSTALQFPRFIGVVGQRSGQALQLNDCLRETGIVCTVLLPDGHSALRVVKPESRASATGGSVGTGEPGRTRSQNDSTPLSALETQIRPLPAVIIFGGRDYGKVCGHPWIASMESGSFGRRPGVC